ncbi:MAG: cation transporter [Opitutales bacterium]|nr:cation transporter [Opitutales bacterium]
MNAPISNDSRLKVRVQACIVAGSVALMAAKFAAYAITNSVAVLTDAMESIVNVLAGAISLYSLRLASRPKDGDHPFGHGKIELISASIEGLMIVGAGAMIVFEGAKRLIYPAEVERLDVGLAVVAASALANFIMGSISIAIGKKYDSIALVAGGRHLHSDTWSTVGLVAGLGLMVLTNIVWIDSALALVFGLMIFLTGCSILRKTVANLTDEADLEVLKRLLSLINEHKRDEWVDVHNMRVIKYGSHYYIDCDLTLPKFYTIESGHDSYKIFKADILEHFSDNLIFSIHFDPCRPRHCKFCSMKNCAFRSAEFEKKLELDLSCLASK